MLNLGRSELTSLHEHLPEASCPFIRQFCCFQFSILWYFLIEYSWLRMNLPELWVFILFLYPVSSDTQNTAVNFEKLVQIEDSIIQIFQSYISQTEHQIRNLKREFERLEREHRRAINFENKPFNTFLLIKRIILDWRRLEIELSDNFLQQAIVNISKVRSTQDNPTPQDLSRSAETIDLVSSTYNIEVSSLAKGDFNGITFSSHLSGDDCFILGMESYMKKDFQRTLSWMNEALIRFNKEEHSKYVEDTTGKALELKAFSAYKLGDYLMALNVTIEILRHDPNNKEANANLEYYIHMIKKREVTKPEEHTLKDPHWNPKDAELCRRIINYPDKISAQLKCRYIHNNVPFLRLAPLKEEEACLNPKIVLYKEVLYQSEIELLKQLAKTRFGPALVSSKSGSMASRNRQALMAWIDKFEHPMLKNLLLRAQDITKLDPLKTEDIQIVKYGFGGHYKPHWDSLRDWITADKKQGDRIATLLFYMNDVDHGGATVFTKMNVTVRPEKGTALLWYNQLPDGYRIDERVMHGACPVVAGTKWVCTIWFRSIGQELRRPCGLKQ